MELDELHVLERSAGPQGQGGSVAVVYQRVRRSVEYPSVTAGREEHGACGESVQIAGRDVHGDGSDAPSVLDDERGHEVFVVERTPRSERLLEERVKEIVSCPVRGVTCSGEPCAAEGTLRDPSVLEPGEHRTHVFHLVDCFRRPAGKDVHGVLVGEVIGALDRVEGMVLPAVVPGPGSVAQGSVDPALRRHGMRAQRMDLRDHRHVPAGACGLDGSPETRKSRTDDYNIMFMQLVICQMDAPMTCGVRLSGS